MSEEGPVRTCIGCRKAESKKVLIRLAVRREDKRIELDPSASLPGRGAYLHMEAGCIERGLDPRRLARAFRGQVEFPPDLAGEIRKATESVAM